jgi:hypothetical protein
MNNHAELEPCMHVRKYVEAQAHGYERRWYNFLGWLHVKHCPQCQQALARLAAYFNEIKSAQAPSHDEEQIDLMDKLRSKFHEE